jgi:hypothetical protein
MMRYAVESFGPKSSVGLDITEQGEYRIVFAGGSGYIIAQAHRIPGGSRIDLDVQDYYQDAQAFIDSLSGPGGGLIQQLIRRLRG